MRVQRAALSGGKVRPALTLRRSATPHHPHNTQTCLGLRGSCVVRKHRQMRRKKKGTTGEVCPSALLFLLTGCSVPMVLARDASEEEDVEEGETVGTATPMPPPGRHRAPQSFRSVMRAPYDIGYTMPFDMAGQCQPMKRRTGKGRLESLPLTQETQESASAPKDLGPDSMAVAVAGESSLATSVQAAPSPDSVLGGLMRSSSVPAAVPVVMTTGRGQGRGRGGYGRGGRAGYVGRGGRGGRGGHQFPQTSSAGGNLGGPSAAAVQGASSKLW